MPELDLSAPKDMLANLDFRDAMIRWGSEKTSNAEQLWVRCSRDLVFYFDTFVYTFDPRKGASLREIPFILWPYQEDAMQQIIDGICGTPTKDPCDKLIEKSRDMGASWINLGAFEWLWHFQGMLNFKFLSRKEDLVDATDDPDSLMWKVDFMHRHQPGWLLPQIERKSMNITNADNGSVIVGESTNKRAGRGGRQTAMLLDEFAAVEHATAASILSATADVTNCRIFNSTPEGNTGGFKNRRDSMPPEDIITMHWSLHPEKSKGLYFDKDGKRRSPWYDAECKRRSNPTEIAQELDIDYAASDYMFFDASMLLRVKQRSIMDPVERGTLLFNDHVMDEIHFVREPRGKLLVWVRLDYRTQEPQVKNYVMGADISAGTGSSNSVLSVGDPNTKEKVAELAIENLGPHEFARLAVALCKWFHDAKLCWEVNGPGLAFGKEIQRLEYRNVYWKQDPQEWYRRGKQSNKAGWHSSKESKRLLLTDYRSALGSGLFTNPSQSAMDECDYYVEMGNGSLEHSKSQQTEDPTGAKDNHGDRVIADALCSMLMNKTKFRPKTPKRDVIPGSFGWRYQQHKKEMAAARRDEW